MATSRGQKDECLTATREVDLQDNNSTEGASDTDSEDEEIVSTKLLYSSMSKNYAIQNWL